MDKIVERVETALAGVTDPVERRRLLVYRLRVLGYTIHSIAEELNISAGTAHADMQWCYKNLPPAYQNADEFRFIAISQLEEQYQRIIRPRVVTEITETGDVTERIELPSLTAEKVAREIKEMQGKLLGAYQTAVVSEDSDTVTYTLTVNRPNWSDVEDEQAELPARQPQSALEMSKAGDRRFDQPAPEQTVEEGSDTVTSDQ